MSNRGLFITLWFIPSFIFIPFSFSFFRSLFPLSILFSFFLSIVYSFFFLFTNPVSLFLCLSFKLSFSFLFGNFFKHLNILRYMWFVGCFYLSCLSICVFSHLSLFSLSFIPWFLCYLFSLYPLRLRFLTAADSVDHHWRSCDNKCRHIFVTFFSLFMQILIVE